MLHGAEAMQCLLSGVAPTAHRADGKRPLWAVVHFYASYHVHCAARGPPGTLPHEEIRRADGQALVEVAADRRCHALLREVWGWTSQMAGAAPAAARRRRMQAP